MTCFLFRGYDSWAEDLSLYFGSCLSIAPNECIVTLPAGTARGRDADDLSCRGHGLKVVGGGRRVLHPKHMPQFSTFNN